MLNPGVDKVHRDLILGHSLTGMDVHYMAPTEDDFYRAMRKYTDWLDAQITSVSQTVNNGII
jgi:vacuolar-type H+-ATPase subunit F/Vma7